MSMSQAPVSADLERSVRDAILRRTGGQVELLDVQATGRVVLVRGNVKSHYLRQMAQQGVFDVIGASGMAIPVVEIRVSAVNR